MNKSYNLEFENYVKNYKIFIDTYGLLSFGIDKFFKNIIPYLRRYNSKIIIPMRCIEELQEFKNPILKNTAKKVLKNINLFKKYVDIRGEETDNSANNVFQCVFTKYRMRYNLLLITKDENFAKEIYNLNNSKAVARSKKIDVRKISDEGNLIPIISKNIKSNEYTKNEYLDMSKQNKNTPSNKITKFRICKSVTKIEDSKMKITQVPSVYEFVYSYYDNKCFRIYLTKKIGSGGEATIYETDFEKNNIKYMAKVYKKDNNTRRKYEKIKLMLSKPISYPGICYPVAMLFNNNKEFVGFLMPMAKGDQLQRLFIKPIFNKIFPKWKKKDTVELCITILKKIKYLHDRNIIMGDINPQNILIVSPKEVYFVDVDSYQIEDYPCPVGTINYTAPEIQYKHFESFLRTFGNENFAIATMLFMIMLPGKPPYSQQGGEDQITNIIEMDFSYKFGVNTNNKTPDGPWRFIWSHLPYKVKEAFYTVFRKGEKYSTEKTRLSVNDWIPIFKNYFFLLDSGILKKQDEMSEDLFPIRFKKCKNINKKF